MKTHHASKISCLGFLIGAFCAPILWAADVDHDGLDDSVETGTGTYLSPSNTGTSPANADSDGDGVSDGVEVTDRSNPTASGSFSSFSSSLTARYAFEGNAADSSGRVADGSLTGGPAMAQGICGQAIQFDGVNDYFARNPTPTNSLPFTWAMWVKMPATALGGGWTSVMALGGPSTESPAMQIRLIDATHYEMGLYLWRDGYGGGSSGVKTCADSTAWHHLMLTNDSAGMRRLFFDGVQVAAISEPGYGEVNSTLYLGGDIGLGYRSKYLADEVRLYNRALSIEEVAAMYANQVPTAASISGDLQPLREGVTGSVVNLSVTATGNPADFTYQWYFNDVAIPVENGGTGAALAVTIGSTTAGNYRVRVSNIVGSADSAVCLVAPSEDLDADGLGDWREVHVFNTDPNQKDSDADGLFDGAEVITHLTNPTVADSDEDGYFDGFEITRGTSPLQAAQTPAGHSRILTAVEFRFASAVGRSYRVESSTDLNQWQTEEPGILGNGTEVQRFYSTENIPKRFFRAIEESPSGPE